MELKESGDERCFMTDYGIPTIQFGSGGIVVADLYWEDNEAAGVGFILTDSREIGKRHYNIEGKMIDEVGTFLQILSTEPESLQVLIDRLTFIKDAWLTRLDKQALKQLEEQEN